MEHTDIRMRWDDGGFTLRAAAMILENNNLLLVKSRKYAPMYTVGGAVRRNESTSDAAIREAREETGCEFELVRLLFVHERFFACADGENHEITFFYLLKRMDGTIAEGRCTDNPDETLHWVPLGELEKHHLVPAFLSDALINIADDVVHITTREPV